MKLLVFGASGGTGIQVVQQALTKGIEVTAFVRDPGKLNRSNPRLKIVKGDVLQQKSIDLIMPGQEAVICCIGTPAGKTGHLRSVGTKNILLSMEKFGIKRFICQTSLGYGDSVGILKNTSFFFRNIIVPFFLKKTFEEHLKQEKIIRNSQTTWTIVRPGSLLNTGLQGKYFHGDHYADNTWKVKISRADVASFLLRQLKEEQYHHKTVGISS